MKKLFTSLLFMLVFVARPSAQPQTCNTFDISSLSFSSLETSLLQPNNHVFLDQVLNDDGRLPSGVSSNFNNLENIEMTYAADGSPRFVQRATGWSALGSGLNSIVYAIAISGNDVYVGGDFTEAGGNAANYIAKWNGTSWSALGTGVNGSVRGIAISGGNVYVGGFFTEAGGNPASKVAKWDGTSWSALGTGADNDVYTMAASGTDVYAGGQFTSIGGVTTEGIAKWDGTSWSALGTGTSATVGVIAISGSDIYVGGQFTSAGGVPAKKIAKWDGTSWSALGAGLGANFSFVYAIAVSGTDVYAGGAFTSSGTTTGVNRIAKWDGTSWTTLGTGMDNTVYGIAVSGGNVYAVGSFTTANGTAANRIAKWNGTSWSALGSGSGPNVAVRSIVVGHQGLYIIGGFGSIDGNTANYVAYYTDSSLPISLVSATATVEAQTATLRWSTASETNNDRFIIEQQTLQGWKQVGEVRGAGTTTQAQHYTFQVSNLPYGEHSFRLAQYDRNGRVSYSGPISAFVELLEAFALSEAYPNPFNPSTNFTLAIGQTQNVQIRVYDVQGRQVALLHEGRLAGQTTHPFSFNAQGLPSGKYLVRVQGENFVASKTITLVK